jgi:hypothetical protein
MILEALKARNKVAAARPNPVVSFRAFSARRLLGTPPGALPQAITFRAFGAFKPIGRRTEAVSMLSPSKRFHLSSTDLVTGLMPRSMK